MIITSERWRIHASKIHSLDSPNSDLQAHKDRRLITSRCDLFSGNRAAPPPPIQTSREEPTPKKKQEEEDEEEETSSSSEETESDTEEESETDVHPSNAAPSSTSSVPQDRQRNESAMARTDIGPLLARSAEARRGSKEDSPSTRQVSLIYRNESASGGRERQKFVVPLAILFVSLSFLLFHRYFVQ